MSIETVLSNIIDGRFKPNVACVTIDFLVRRGILTPEMPHYLALVGSLRQGECR